MRLPKPYTLRGRLASLYAGTLVIVLVAFGVMVYLVATDTVYFLATAGDAGETVHRIGRGPMDRRLYIALALGFPSVVLMALASGLVISGRALAPLDEVIRIASSLDAKNLGKRMPGFEGAGQEVERLASALNAMLDRMERSVGGLRRFTADASHELRTPVSALMGNLEVTLWRPRQPAELRAAMEGALEELGQLSRLIESLLTLARSDADELPIFAFDIDAGEVVARVLGVYEGIAGARGIRLSGQINQASRVLADPLWLERAVSNLVDNACKFTPGGGSVVVGVTSVGGRVRIAVSDTGPGLSDEERVRVFERFYRGDAARGSSQGFGLGLPLAHEVVRAMGGQLRLERRDEGGTLACVELPASEHPG